MALDPLIGWTENSLESVTPSCPVTTNEIAAAVLAPGRIMCFAGKHPVFKVYINTYISLHRRPCERIHFEGNSQAAWDPPHGSARLLRRMLDSKRH